MKLFLLEKKEADYQSYVFSIVCAPDEATARKIHPDEDVKDDWPEIASPDHTYAIDCWTSPERVQVTYLGEADPSIKAGIIRSGHNGD